MYIFNRSTVIALGKQEEAIPAAIAIAAKVGEVCGQTINVFAAHYGAPLGSIMWSTRYESHAARQDMFEKLNADAGYLDMVRGMNGMFMTPAEDRIGRVLAGTLGEVSRFYAVTQAAMTAGKYGEAIDFGMKMSDYIAKALDVQTAFMTSSFGGFADVTWLLGVDSMADMDRFEDFQMSDAGYQGMVQSAAGLFVENSGHNSLIEKLN